MPMCFGASIPIRTVYAPIRTIVSLMFRLGNSMDSPALRLNTSIPAFPFLFPEVFDVLPEFVTGSLCLAVLKREVNKRDNTDTDPDKYDVHLMCLDIGC